MTSWSTARSCLAPVTMEPTRIRSVGACLFSPSQQPKATRSPSLPRVPILVRFLPPMSTTPQAVELSE